MVTVARELSDLHSLIKHFVLLCCYLSQAIHSFANKVTEKPAAQVFFLPFCEELPASVNCVRSFKTPPLCEQAGIFLKTSNKIGSLIVTHDPSLQGV